MWGDARTQYNQLLGRRVRDEARGLADHGRAEARVDSAGVEVGVLDEFLARLDDGSHVLEVGRSQRMSTCRPR